MRILGVDPGSRTTGFGLIDAVVGTNRFVAAGVIRTGEVGLAERLHAIFSGLATLIDRQRPEVFAVEQVFVHRNAAAALKLGQARGAALCAAASRGLAVHEYAPRTVKQAIAGVGSADKVQVQYMVRVLLQLRAALAEDAADALAVALCHSHTHTTLGRFRSARGPRARRWR